MTGRWYCSLCFAILATCAATSCAKTNRSTARDPQDPNQKPQVFTLNYPLAYFAERIGGDRVDVHFPAPPDVDPAYWNPKAETVAEYQEADVILLNGADYDKWIERASLPLSKLVNTSQGVGDRFIRIENSVTHQHGPSGEHTHEGIAFTTWLDFRIAIEQARAVKEAFVKLRPGHKTEFEANFASLEQDLKEIDARIEEIVSPRREQPLVVSHPVFQYLANRYGLNIQSVHWEPNLMPDEKSWAEFEKLLAAHPAKWMIWEDDPIEPSTARLASLGIQSIVFKPAGNVPADGDFLSTMRDNADRLKPAFE